MILKSPKAVTPEKVNKQEAGPSRLLQKRGNQGKLMGNVAANPDLRQALALKGKSQLQAQGFLKSLQQLQEFLKSLQPCKRQS